MSLLLYGLATAFMLGILLVGALITKIAWEDGGLFGLSLVGLLGVPMIAFLGAMLFAAIAQNDSQILATLHKGEWTCTEGHHVTTMVLVGKIMVPQIRFVCDTYSR